MQATQSWAERIEEPSQRPTRAIRSIPAAIHLLYALEPIAAAVSLICLAPFLAMLAIAIGVLSGASPLVAHRRVGRHGKTLWVYKLRTMWPSENHSSTAFWIERVPDDKPELKNGPDPRVTSRFAAFLRRHSIDELPQLALVIAGRMSLVGPRPITQFELDEYYRPDSAEVLSLKPGLTGLWQVRGRSRCSFDEMVRMDLQHGRQNSLVLYFKVLFETPGAVIHGSGAH